MGMRIYAPLIDGCREMPKREGRRVPRTLAFQNEAQKHSENRV